MQDTEPETWKAIPGESNCEASHLGRVRRGDDLLEPWEIDRYGHQAVGLRIGGAPVPVHRAVAKAFHGWPPAGKPLVRHLDGNPRNNRADNLKWGDAFENSQDMLAHGTQRKRTKCRKGHPLKGENVYLALDGRGRCAPCLERAIITSLKQNLPLARSWRVPPQLERVGIEEWALLIQNAIEG